MNTSDDIDPNQIRAASMAQDLAYMRANLGASGMRRVLADLIDVGIATGIAVGLAEFGYSIWWCLSYFVIRDCIPLNRSLGKHATGVQIRRADDLTATSFTQRFFRGLVNTAILAPLGLLIATFMAFVFGLILFAGFILLIKRRDSIFLEMMGYDYATGRTIADRIVGTHLVTIGELETLQATTAKLQSLRIELSNNSKTTTPL